MKWLVPPVLFFACLAAMIASSYFAPSYPLIPSPYNWIGVLVGVIGLLIGIAGSATFVRKKTELNTFKNPGELVTTGVFAISRNPMYLGFFLLLLGVALVLGGTAPFAIALLFFLIAQFWYVRFEEARMQAAFGERFEAYRRKTRRWI